MKSLFVSEYWQPNSQGGGEESAAVLASALAERGVSVTVLTSHFNEELAEETQNKNPKRQKRQGIKDIVGIFNVADTRKVFLQPDISSEGISATNKVRVLRRISTGTSPGRFWSNVKRAIVFPFSAQIQVKKLLCQEEFDAIHYVNVSSAMAKTNTRIHSFVHVNSPVFFCPKGTLMYRDQKECHYKCTPYRFLECFVHSHVFGKMQNKWYYKYNPGVLITLYAAFRIRMFKLKRFDKYVAVSGFMQQKLLETGVNERKTQVISNIVSVPKLVKTRNKKPAILYLGDYIAQKGVMELLKGLLLVKKDYDCDFYGSGPLYNVMQEFVKNNGLKNVQINSRITQERALSTIATHDIVIQPSLVPEAMSRTVLQAMAAGKAVITSNRGGMKDYIQHEKEGLIVDPSVPREVARAIEYCLDKKVCERLGKNAIAKVQQTSSANVVTDKFLLLYKSPKHITKE